MTTNRPITPCLWFDNQAEEAAHHYVGIFRNSRITDIGRYGEAAIFIRRPWAQGLALAG